MGKIVDLSFTKSGVRSWTGARVRASEKAL